MLRSTWPSCCRCASGARGFAGKSWSARLCRGPNAYSGRSHTSRQRAETRRKRTALRRSSAGLTLIRAASANDPLLFHYSRTLSSIITSITPLPHDSPSSPALGYCEPPLTTVLPSPVDCSIRSQGASEAQASLLARRPLNDTAFLHLRAGRSNTVGTDQVAEIINFDTRNNNHHKIAWRGRYAYA